MGRRGGPFALSEEQVSRLMDTPGMDDEGLLAFVEEIEEGPDAKGWDAEWVQETDKAWDAIQRCLTDGRVAGRALLRGRPHGSPGGPRRTT
jgi:hypothetical protein